MPRSSKDSGAERAGVAPAASTPAAAFVCGALAGVIAGSCVVSALVSWQARRRAASSSCRRHHHHEDAAPATTARAAAAAFENSAQLRRGGGLTEAADATSSSPSPSPSSSSDDARLACAPGRRHRSDDAVIHDLFSMPAPPAEAAAAAGSRARHRRRRSCRRRQVGTIVATAATAGTSSAPVDGALACLELMASSDEELAAGGGDAYYGRGLGGSDTVGSGVDDGDGLPVAVCRRAFAASRPCEVPLAEGDHVRVVHNDSEGEEFWTVLKLRPARHLGVAPASVLSLLAPAQQSHADPSRPSRQRRVRGGGGGDGGGGSALQAPRRSALRDADKFAACKAAWRRGAECSHERARRAVLLDSDRNGSGASMGAKVVAPPLQFPFRVAVVDPVRGRGLFAVRPIPASTVLERCPFVLDAMSHVTGRLEDYVFQLQVRNGGGSRCSDSSGAVSGSDGDDDGDDDGAEDMYAFLQGYGSLYNHSNYASVDYVLPAQPVDPRKPQTHVVDFVAKRDIMAGEELTINYGSFYWSKRPHTKHLLL